jgi:hypothetical protein
LRPFASLPADSLAKIGYSTPEAGSEVYRAPDADALLSNAFASLYCFHVEPAPATHADWIGLGFAPARFRAGIVDIEGTLWLDRLSSELRRLDFTYTSLPRELAPARAGGTLEFMRLVDGTWLIRRWILRMPRATLVSIHRPTLRPGDSGLVPSAATELSLDGLHFAGAEVTYVGRGGAVVYSAGEGNVFVVGPP